MGTGHDSSSLGMDVGLVILQILRGVWAGVYVSNSFLTMLTMLIRGSHLRGQRNKETLAVFLERPI